MEAAFLDQKNVSERNDKLSFADQYVHDCGQIVGVKGLEKIITIQDKIIGDLMTANRELYAFNTKSKCMVQEKTAMLSRVGTLIAQIKSDLTLIFTKSRKIKKKLELDNPEENSIP